MERTLLSLRDLRIKDALGKINSSRHSSRRYQGIPGAQETGAPPAGIAPGAPHPGLSAWKAKLEPRVSILKELKTMRFEQQHNNKPQTKQTEGSGFPVRAGRAHGAPRFPTLLPVPPLTTLVWDGSDPTKASAATTGALGTAEPPRNPLPPGSSPIPAERLLLQAGSAARETPQGTLQGALPGRCRCSSTALSTGCPRPLPRLPQNRESFPASRGTNRLGNTTPSVDSPHPIPAEPWGRPRQCRSQRFPDPRTAPHRALSTGAGSGTGPGGAGPALALLNPGS